METIKNISNYFSISRESLVIRLYHLSYFSRNEADSLIDEIKKTYKKQKSKGFITPINDLLSKYGKPMTRVLFDNYNKGYIHVDDFYSYTGLKEKHVSNLQNNI